jgi:hypothetical protein
MLFFGNRTYSHVFAGNSLSWHKLGTKLARGNFCCHQSISISTHSLSATTTGTIRGSGVGNFGRSFFRRLPMPGRAAWIASRKAIVSGLIRSTSRWDNGWISGQSRRATVNPARGNSILIIRAGSVVLWRLRHRLVVWLFPCGRRTSASSPSARNIPAYPNHWLPLVGSGGVLQRALQETLL